MNDTGRFLVKCVFRYSANENCKESARKLLLAYSTGDDEGYTRELGYTGSFMQACAKGDVIGAYFKADSLNKIAIELAMRDIFEGGKVFNEGLAPDEFRKTA